MSTRFVLPRLRANPIVLVGLVAVAAVAYTAYTPAPLLEDAPEITVPIGIAVALLLFTVQLRSQGYGSQRARRAVRYGWTGALIAVTISGWWIALRVYEGLAVTGLGEEMLTVWSVGIGAGVFVGSSVTRRYAPTLETNHGVDRDRVLAETVWVNRSESNPILVTVVEQLADLEGVRPTELEPIWNHVDPEVFTALREHDGSEWQFFFHTETYRIGVNSHGTVTVYDRRHDDGDELARR